MERHFKILFAWYVAVALLAALGISVTRILSTPLLAIAAIALLLVTLVWIILPNAAIYLHIIHEYKGPQIGYLRQLLAEQSAGRVAVYVIDVESTQAMAFRIGREKMLVLSTGLLSQYPAKELAAIVLHELGHFRHHDIELYTATAICISSVAGIIGGVFRALELYEVLIIPIILLGPLFAFSRARERAADVYALGCLEDPSQLVSALRRTIELRDHPELDLNPIWQFLSSHPPFQERIVAAERFSQ